jgi:major vault protein
MSEVREKRDLSLYPGNYAFIQDASKGNIKVCTGPTVITPSAQDKPVIYDEKKRTFVSCASLEEAVRISVVAVEGYYVELLNPAKDNQHPSDGQSQNGADLLVGRKINIPGPSMFALWPGQVATIIRGHHLRSNQYLLCRVYNEEEARKNWGNAIIKKAGSTLTAPADTATADEKKAYEAAVAKEKKDIAEANKAPSDFTVGKQFIIRGTEVSFYIPPTGITVVPEAEHEGKAVYTREALTLERLEYSILVDENGRKRYETGPAVVFPQPTERFIHDEDKNKKFRAIELNDIQGLHLKVIADYEEGGQKYKAGQELFITGKDTAIYYPREEHSAIKYDGKTKHFATAVPAGEARYVLNRMNGEIKMVKGPSMLLPDPRTEIIVRRVLSDKQVSLWYPGNAEALSVNQGLRTLAMNAPTTRAGTVSEGELERASKALSRGRGEEKTKGMMLSYSANAMMESSSVSKEQNVVGQEFSRQSTYTQPRTITLEGKYQGVPTVELWTNYGVMVVSKTGERRVETGPTTIQLEYDESLEVLELSTGKPKTTDNLIRTVYLRVENNKVADIVQVETADHVTIDLRLSYLVNFEGDKEKWFAVENYVKFLCDHVRSVLKGEVKKIQVEQFYANSTDIIRNILIGADKKGMFFSANSMRLTDTEVLGVTIKDDKVRQLLDSTQISVVQTNIELFNLRRGQEVLKEKESIRQVEAQTMAETVKMKNELDKELLASTLAVNLIKMANSFKEMEEKFTLLSKNEELETLVLEGKLSRDQKTINQRLELQKSEQAQRIEFLKAETEAVVQKYASLDVNFTSALLALSNNETLAKVAEAWNIQRAIGGDSVSDALSKVFAGGPLEKLVKSISNSTGNGADVKKAPGIQAGA